MYRIIQAFLDFISPESNTPQIGQVWELPNFAYTSKGGTITSLATVNIVWVDEEKVGLIRDDWNYMVEYMPLKYFQDKAVRRVK